ILKGRLGAAPASMFVYGPLVLWPEALVELLAPPLLAIPPRAGATRVLGGSVAGRVRAVSIARRAPALTRPGVLRATCARSA
ncbi:MAG: hypothetical protein M3069_11850, partial [Chloroflexota bacterium]|nr:hypothetical protein [Chloroflexota bacterium]